MLIERNHYTEDEERTEEWRCMSEEERFARLCEGKTQQEVDELRFRLENFDSAASLRALEQELTDRIHHTGKTPNPEKWQEFQTLIKYTEYLAEAVVADLKIQSDELYEASVKLATDWMLLSKETSYVAYEAFCTLLDASGGIEFEVEGPCVVITMHFSLCD